MPIGATIQESFRRSFQLYQDLIDAIDEAWLSSNLGSVPSNTLGEQLWCVVGARESYHAAIAANKWNGFSCSLATTTKKQDIAEALRRSAESVTSILGDIDDFSDEQNRLVVDLLEHEAAHHGQLIRYIYVLKLPIPASWKSKYALAEK